MVDELVVLGFLSVILSVVDSVIRSENQLINDKDTLITWNVITRHITSFSATVNWNRNLKILKILNLRILNPESQDSESGTLEP